VCYITVMNDAESETDDFIRERRAGMIAIAAAMLVARLLWLAIGAALPIAVFLVIEGCLFRATRPLLSTDRP
jgi:hypothetical protein